VRAELVAYIAGTPKNKPMTTPGVFKFAASPEAQVAIQRQLDIFLSLIRHSTEEFASHSVEAVAVVKFVLEELLFASRQIPLVAIDSHFKECRSQVVQRLQSLSEQAAAHLDRVCEPGEQLGAVDAAKLLSCMQFVRDAGDALCKLFTKEEGIMACHKGLQSKLTIHAGRLASRITEELTANTRVLSAPISKLLTLSAEFKGDCSVALDNVRAQFETRLENQLFPIVAEEMQKFNTTTVGESSSTTPHERAAHIIALLSQLREVCSALRMMDTGGCDVVAISSTESKEACPSDAHKLRLDKLIHTQLADTKRLLVQAVESKMVLEGQALVSCRHRLEYLNILSNDSTFDGRDAAKGALLEWEVALDNIIDDTRKEVIDAFTVSRQQAFAVIEGSMARLYPLCRELGPALVARTCDTWLQLVEKLSGYLYDIKRDVEGAVSRFLSGHPDIDWEQLSGGLTALQGAEWMNKYKEDVVAKVVGETKQLILRALTNKVDDAFRYVPDEPLSQAAGMQVQGAMTVFEHLRHVQPLEAVIAELPALRQRFEAKFASLLSRGLKTVYTLYTDDFKQLAVVQEVLQDYAKELSRQYDAAATDIETVLTERQPLAFCDIDAVKKEIKKHQAAVKKCQKDIIVAKEKLSAANEKLSPHKINLAGHAELRKSCEGAEKDDLPEKLHTYLKEHGYDNLGVLKNKIKECTDRVDRVKTKSQKASKRKDEAISTVNGLNSLLKDYDAKKANRNAEALHSATDWLTTRCQVSGLPPDKASLDKLCADLLQRTSDDLLVDQVVRAGRTTDDLDLKVDNDAYQYLSTIKSVQLDARLGTDFPKLLRMAKAALEKYLKRMLEDELEAVTDSIRKAQAFNHAKKQQVAEALRSASAGDNSMLPTDSPKMFAHKLGRALGNLENIERTYPALFSFLESSKHNPGGQSLQSEINHQLVNLYESLEQDLATLSQQMGEHAAKVEVAQYMAKASDHRFSQYDPKPRASESCRNESWGSFHVLFLMHRTQAMKHVHGMLSEDLFEKYFAQEQDDIILTKLEKLKGASDVGAQEVYQKRMQSYEHSLVCKMEEHEINLDLLDRVRDSETLKIYKVGSIFCRDSGGPTACRRSSRISG